MPSASSKLLFRILLAIAAGITLWRLTGAASSSNFVDFSGYLGVATSLVHGELPFARSSPDIVAAPTIVLLYAPFVALPYAAAGHLFFAINCLVALWLALAMVRGAGRVLERPLGAEAAAALVLWFLNSGPVLETLRNGQCSLLIALGLLLALGGTAPIRGLGLVLMVALKPTFGLFGLQLLSLRRFAAAALAAAALVLLALSPALFGCDLHATYAEFLSAVARSQQPGGINNPSVHGANILSLDFITLRPLQQALRLLVGLIALAAMWLDFKQRRALSINSTLLVAMASLCVVYHRFYDATMILPLLALATLSALRAGQMFRVAAGSLTGLFFLLPLSLVLKASEWIGAHADAASSVISLSPYKPLALLHVFPTYACVTLLITVLAIDLRFRGAAIVLTPQGQPLTPLRSAG